MSRAGHRKVTRLFFSKLKGTPQEFPPVALPPEPAKESL